ncbi:MAG TPA: HIT family protein [bacterium]
MPSTFTRIIRRELPAHVVYEDAHAIAFLDLHPKAEGHTLVVPRHEVASFHELPPEDAAHLARALRTVAGAVSRAMGTPHYNLALNNGAPAGQVIFHVHFHIIPRHEGVPRSRMPLSLSAARMDAIAAVIRAAVAEGQPLFE